MPRDIITQGETIQDLQNLAATMAAYIKEVPHLEAPRDKLVGLLTQVGPLITQQADLGAQRQEVSKNIRALLTEARRLGNFLRIGLKEQPPFGEAVDVQDAAVPGAEGREARGAGDSARAVADFSHADADFPRPEDPVAWGAIISYRFVLGVASATPFFTPPAPRRPGESRQDSGTLPRRPGSSARSPGNLSHRPGALAQVPGELCSDPGTMARCLGALS